MPSAAAHVERHLSHRVGWLRAAVLGANDGITSTAALIVGVAAADASRGAVFTAGMAALVAGAGSMAAGEYGSVSSQRDSELADIAKERMELETMPDRELKELTRIYIDKGLNPPLAHEVAVELSKGDVLAVHMAEELGITHDTVARPLQAATYSALSFAAGAAVPLIAVMLAGSSSTARVIVTFVVALLALAGLGAAGARAGGAAFGKPTLRMLVLGGLAMAVTALVGKVLGTAVS
ncbi:MAG: VIT1/CCC1 transporter family protein [Acidimicrobiales bacterium]